MKTWKEYVEAKAKLAPMDQQPAQYQPGFTPRRSATLNLNPAQRAAGAQAHQAATQVPQVGPVSDEEMGAQYAKSMQIQQAMAKARRQS